MRRMHLGWTAHEVVEGGGVDGLAEGPRPRLLEAARALVDPRGHAAALAQNLDALHEPVCRAPMLQAAKHTAATVRNML
eukprot:3684422-Pleurochrysis_carterae.AAC.2